MLIKPQLFHLAQLRYFLVVVTPVATTGVCRCSMSASVIPQYGIASGRHGSCHRAHRTGVIRKKMSGRFYMEINIQSSRCKHTPQYETDVTPAVFTKKTSKQVRYILHWLRIVG